MTRFERATSASRTQRTLRPVTPDNPVKPLDRPTHLHKTAFIEVRIAENRTSGEI